MSDKLLNLNILYSIISLETYILLTILVLANWIIYKGFLVKVSAERHRSLKKHFFGLFRNFVFLSVFFVTFLFVHRSEGDFEFLQRIAPYLGLLTFLWGSMVFVKSCRLLVLEYLFMGSIQAGVPILLVNIFSLLLSIMLVFWVVSRVFGVQLGPLLATSAAFSIVLGLALQDTLGNLFAGISLQLDKSYEIGDWIEVTYGAQKSIGQVKEITWRSTLLVGFSEELITLPNRFMAQAQISNYSPPDQPIVRSQTFKIPFGSSIDKAKEVLEAAATGIEEVRNLPAPFAFVRETMDSAICVKLIYFIDSYGAQYVVGDKVLRKGIEALSQNGIEMFKPEFRVENLSN
jgi:small-conductance mechanosensitive channel